MKKSRFTMQMPTSGLEAAQHFHDGSGLIGGDAVTNGAVGLQSTGDVAVTVTG